MSKKNEAEYKKTKTNTSKVIFLQNLIDLHTTSAIVGTNILPKFLAMFQQ